MKIFRNIQNGKLYTIERVLPARMTGAWYEAIPYQHNDELRPWRKKLSEKRRAKMSEFIVVAEN